MENLTFASSAEFLAWLDGLSNDPAQRERFDRVPVDRQFWSYGDGHIAGTRAGLRGGTLLANLRLMRSTGSGALDHVLIPMKSPMQSEMIAPMDSERCRPG